MAVNERGRVTPTMRANELLRQRAVLARADQRRAELAARVEGYERRYGIKSHAVHAAIDRGELKETQEVCRWIIDYDLLRRTKDCSAG